MQKIWLAILLALVSLCGWAHQAPREQLGSAAAFAPDGRLWLVGVNGHGGLFVQTAPAHNLNQWDAPRVLATQGDAIAAHGESRPKLVFGPKGEVLITYNQPLAKPDTGTIRMLRSTDGGQSFSQPFTVQADRQEITHRFETSIVDAQGALHTVWVDKRDLELAPKVGKKSSYRGAAIYRNVSTDGGATFGPDIRVADHACECCRLALALGTDGRARAIWRHVFEPNVRDHAITVLDADQPTQVAPIVRATFDDWQINACPHHGPSLAAASDGGFHAVWFGVRKQGAEALAAVRYARLNTHGSPQPDSVRALPDERAEHAEVLAAGARVAVVWRSVDGARSSLKAWLSDDDGKTFALKVLGEVAGANDLPHLVQQGARMVVVWRSAKGVQVHELSF